MLTVVSIRRMRPNLSYSLSETAPMVCLIRSLDADVETVAHFALELRAESAPRKVAILSGLTVWIAVRARFS